MIEAILEAAKIDNTDFGNLEAIDSLSGGCICDAYRLKDTQGRQLFLKTGGALPVNLLELEAEALQELSKTNTLRVPMVIAVGKEPRPYLCLEFIEFSSPQGSSYEKLGTQLAELHQHSANQYGWSSDNFAGETPQQNQFSSSWIDFFRESRLIPQIRLAETKGLKIPRIDQFLDSLDKWFPEESSINPALLHGDLWSGNVAFENGSNPTLFDPALYYGHREIDLAMTQLFGGFPESFYKAYSIAWPLDEGHEDRVAIYNLYPVLNHYNLFGGSYGDQAQHIVASYL